MIRNYIIYIILIHLLASFNVAANSLSHPKFYNIKQKGEDFVAYNFIQDPSGYLWIGSNKGLYSYDGYKIRNYSKYGDNTFTQIYDLDINGDCIYLSTDNGLQIYNYVADKYVPMSISMPKDIRSTLILNDKAWLGTLNGLYEYSTKSNSIKRVSFPGLSNNTVYSTLRASNGDIYVGTYDGLFKLDKGSQRFTSISLPKSSIRNNILVNSLVEDKNRNSLWVGTEGGLYEYSLKNNTTKEIGELKEISIKSLSISNNDNLYVGTDNGLFIYNGKDVKHYLHDSQNEFSIPNNIIWGTFIGKNGDVWIGTESNFSVLNQDDNFNIIPLTQITNTGAGNTIYSILRDSKANLWLGGTNGLIKTNEDFSQYTWFTVDNKQYSLPHNRIRDIYEDRSHNLWIAGDGSINKYNYSSNKFLTYQISDSTGTLNSNWAYNIFEDKNDNFWIGTCLGGIFEINADKLLEKGSNLIADYNISSKNGLSGNFINQLIGDSNGNVWALLYNNGGVYTININTKSIKKIDFEKKFKENPSYLIADNKGNVWSALHGGVVRLDSNGNISEKIPLGIFDDSQIYSMEFVDDNLWLSSNEGVWYIDTNNLKSYLLDLPNKEYKSIYYDRDSKKVYLGGSNELLITNSDIVKQKRQNVSIYLTGLEVNNKPYLSKDKSIRYLDEFKLATNENHITLQFSDLSYNADKGTRFVYRMKGIDKNWQLLPDNENQISYANLSSGKYKFEITYINEFVLPSNNIRTITIIIDTPWYASIWAIIVYIILLLGFVIWIINFFRVRNKLRLIQRDKERVIEQAKSKIDFFTNISHEFKTPLSMIIGPVGKLIDDNKNGNINKNLLLIQQNAKKLNSLIHGAIEFENLEKAGDNMLIYSRIEAVEFCKAILDTFIINYPDKEFRFQTNTENLMIEADFIKLESILNNILSNACKYTSNNGIIILSIEKVDNKINITISDDGIGISQSEIPYIFQRLYQSSRTKNNIEGSGIGLYLAKSYVELHNGSIYVESKENEGTKFVISLPINRNDEGYDHYEIVESQKEKSTILIVDDNKSISSFLKDLLYEDYNCLIADNGAEALKICNSNIPDLIIVDFLMPIMNGLEFSKEIKHIPSLSQIPIILLTAQDDKKTEAMSIKLNIDVFMSKPFDSNILISRIRQLLQSRKEMRRNARIEAITNVTEIEAQSNDEKLLSDITNIIEENISNPDLNVNFVCEKSGYGSKLVYRKIKNQLGVSPVEYIRDIRLKKAALLLKQKKFTVSEVMYMVGFSSPSYFSKCFTAKYKITPKQFLEEL